MLFRQIWKTRQRRQLWGIARSGLFLVGLIGLAIWLSRTGSIHVSKVVMATELDSSFRPVQQTDFYSPSDTFFVSFKLEGYQASVPIVARWKYQGQIINETPLKTDDVGDGYAGFSLSHSESNWPVGNYSVEVFANGQLLGSAVFQVRVVP